MWEDDLWESFKKTGRIADYLRYRGVDIYAAQNSLNKEGTADVPQSQTNSTADPHRRSDHPNLQ
ncbi:MAG: hypothetical protein IJN07_01140 [Clostridia bacterium]|nr:hypothetical protein [Clostridia bacterium]